MEESFKAIVPRGPDLFSFTRTVRARCRRDRTGVGCESNIPAVAGILLTEKLSDVPFTYEAPGQQTDIESELRGPAIEDLFWLGQQIEKKCGESMRLENMCNRLIATVMAAASVSMREDHKALRMGLGYSELHRALLCLDRFRPRPTALRAGEDQ